LSVFAQIPAAPDASGFPSGRNAFDFPTALPPALIPRRGIRIGDEMNEAERKFLALKVASLSPKPACAVPTALIGSKPALMFWTLGST
jgi:hypothetical protein